jgi:hypothetical protein
MCLPKINGMNGANLKYNMMMNLIAYYGPIRVCVCERARARARARARERAREREREGEGGR